MKKKMSKVLLLAVLFFTVFAFSTSSFAYESNGNYENGKVLSTSDSKDVSSSLSEGIVYKDGEILSTSDKLEGPPLTKDEEASLATISEDNPITPYGFYLYKDKTIVVSYSTFSAIPETYVYEEYTGGYWYRGTLFLNKTEKVSSGWKATFSGKLSSWLD